MGKILQKILEILFKRPPPRAPTLPKPPSAPKPAGQQANQQGSSSAPNCVGTCGPKSTPDPIKKPAKLERQMKDRGWTDQQIDEAIKNGQQYPAINNATGGPATRYVHPQTGRSVVIDNQTRGVIHVGGDGFKY